MAVAAAALMLCACQDFLTRDAENQTTEEAWWYNKSILNTVVNQCYAPMPGGTLTGSSSVTYARDASQTGNEYYYNCKVENEGLSDNGVTVANYPHWVDFDCGTTKTLKGFSYLPRQDSRNGNIKQYRVQLSTDGKTWGNPICEGQFENNQKEKRVLFDKPQQARYLRFTALSSQDGQDFATGAEFSVLEQ